MIESNDIILRPLTPEDTPFILKWRNSPSVSNNFVYREKLTEEHHKKYFESNILTGKTVQFIIVEKGDSFPIGSVYLRDIDLKNEKAEFGIFIGEESERGKGYGRQAAELICGYGFSKLGLNKITLRAFPYNVEAIKMYRTVGFKQEAYFKQDVKIDGKFEDMIHMAILSTEYMTLQSHGKMSFYEENGNSTTMTKN